ncbi:MAG: hypothetical protein WCG25_01455 [bacterium]
MGFILSSCTSSTFHPYQSTHTIAELLHLILIFILSGLMILYPNGKDANPPIHHT